MVSSQRKGPLCMVAASIMWSFGGLCIKLIPWSAMSIVGLRAVLASVVFIIYRKSAKIEFTRGNLLAAGCLSATMLLFVLANKLTTSAAAILLQFSSPVFIILIQLLLYKHRPKRSEIVAVSITLLGMLMFFADALQEGGLLGNILAIGSGAAFAGVFVCNKMPDTKAEQAMLLSFYISSVIGLPFAFFSVTPDPVAWGTVIFLGLVQIGIAYLFFTIGIKSTPALMACLITALEPVLNPVWVALATGEVPGFFALMGGVIIIVTVVGYNIWEERH